MTDYQDRKKEQTERLRRSIGVNARQEMGSEYFEPVSACEAYYIV